MDDSGIGGGSNMLCARFLVASEQIVGSGPVAAALRSAGHLTESEEEEGDEEERSSTEEEGAEEVYGDINASTELSVYSTCYERLPCISMASDVPWTMA